MKIHTIALTLALFATPAFANLSYEFKQLVGSGRDRERFLSAFVPFD